ncbi:17100_t:CDS:1, partial [Acaulospora morrowiae]
MKEKSKFPEFTFSVADVSCQVTDDDTTVANFSVEDEFDTAQTIIHVASDTIKLFFPWVEGLTRLLDEATNAYENAKYNKATCVLLYDRIENGVFALRKLYRHREDNEKDFRSKSFYRSFIKFINIMNRIKDFIKEISELNSCMQYIKSNTIKKKLDSLIKEYESSSTDLHLAITVYSAEQTEKELNAMHKDIEHTKK